MAGFWLTSFRVCSFSLSSISSFSCSGESWNRTTFEEEIGLLNIELFSRVMELLAPILILLCRLWLSTLWRSRSGLKDFLSSPSPSPSPWSISLGENLGFVGATNELVNVGEVDLDVGECSNFDSTGLTASIWFNLSLVALGKENSSINWFGVLLELEGKDLAKIVHYYQKPTTKKVTFWCSIQIGVILIVWTCRSGIGGCRIRFLNLSEFRFEWIVVPYVLWIVIHFSE